MQENISSSFIEGLRCLGLLDQEAALIASFLRYRQELLDWNTRINLTAITDPDEVLSKHFLDSLSLLKACEQAEIRLLDIGSGAGFPGLPLKIARPRWRVTLMEATGKKTTFLQHVISSLGLTGIDVVHGRAEELAHRSAYRAAFDVVTARAVSALPTLLEYCAPYCRVRGSIVLPKKGDLSSEIEQGRRAASLVGAVFKADVPVDLPDLEDGRRLFVWQQQKLCPANYPRSGAAMAKRPLG
jgi:16S rRNA (guanine527-N7)-methyltransferase